MLDLGFQVLVMGVHSVWSVNTQGTLKPGSKLDWLNEIHPTSGGFHKVYKKIYKAMKGIVLELPS